MKSEEQQRRSENLFKKNPGNKDEKKSLSVQNQPYQFPFIIKDSNKQKIPYGGITEEPSEAINETKFNGSSKNNSSTKNLKKIQGNNEKSGFCIENNEDLNLNTFSGGHSAMKFESQKDISPKVNKNKLQNKSLGYQFSFGSLDGYKSPEKHYMNDKKQNKESIFNSGKKTSATKNNNVSKSNQKSKFGTSQSNRNLTTINNTPTNSLNYSTIGRMKQVSRVSPWKQGKVVNHVGSAEELFKKKLSNSPNKIKLPVSPKKDKQLNSNNIMNVNELSPDLNKQYARNIKSESKNIFRNIPSNNMENKKVNSRYTSGKKIWDKATFGDKVFKSL